ncbi:MAG: DUF3828 domain-containing protein [Bacteroidales bacterium]|nr:DUF3828 domain-containing protein [Bacteroidales bacterium]
MKQLFASAVITLSLCAACTMNVEHKATYTVEKSEATFPTQTKVPDAMGFVRSFYTAYTSSFYNGASPLTIDSLKNACLTKPLLEKMKRLISETGADPIIRAQDFSERIAKTLAYKSLKDDWFLVQYVDTKDTVSIPVKVVKVGEKFMIGYITPFWNDSAFGDSLFISSETNNSVKKAINGTTALGALKQFYAIYTEEYCRMPENLNERLDTLKTTFCTERLREIIKQQQIAFKAEEPLYDPLILASDFDREWAKSLRIKPEGNNHFLVSYLKKNETKTLKIAMRKINDKFLLDEIVMPQN